MDIGERLAGGDGDVAPNAGRGVEQRHVEFESVFPHVATMPRRDGVRWRMFVQGQILRTGGREVPMERQTLLFVMERETKNTVRFQEEANGKPPVVGTLYVQQWALGQPLPQRLTVTIEAASE